MRELLDCDEYTHMMKENRILRDINSALHERDNYKKMYVTLKESYDKLKNDLDELVKDDKEPITLRMINYTKKFIELEQSAWANYKHKPIYDIAKECLEEEEFEEYEDLFEKIYGFRIDD